MRSLILASLLVSTAVDVGPANAQRIVTAPATVPVTPSSVAQSGASYARPAQVPAPVVVTPAPSVPSAPPPPPPPPPYRAEAPGAPPPPSRWRGGDQGRWEASDRAPGGWQAYRRPSRGYRLPGYWMRRDFAIGDFGYYGLPSPPFGYSWSRYYDDAVLIDGRGHVWDSASGVDWDHGYGGDDQRGYGQQGYEQRGYEQRGYDQQGYGQRYHGGYQHTYQGGPMISDRTPRGGYSQTYTAGAYGSPPAVTYVYPSSGITTVTVVQGPPVITTTTTEYVTEHVYRYAAKKVWRKPARKWHPKPKPRKCSCEPAVKGS